MPKTKWRTVSCADDGLRSHPSQQKAYAWIADRPAGERFRVQFNDGFDWQPYATVTSGSGFGFIAEEV